MPSVTNQITVQLLSSRTRNPNRPDLLDVWTGQQLNGNAGSLAWTHSSNDWYADVRYESYSRDFRSWNGFVTQVGVSSLTGAGILYFYPDRGGFVTRLGPQLTMSRVESSNGSRISHSLSPGFVLHAARDTSVSLAWQPHSETMTLTGPRTYSSFLLGITSTPFPWMPQAVLSATGGDIVDSVTGAIGDGVNFQGTLPLRFSRFEIASTVGYQTLRSNDAQGARTTLLAERNVQMTATWHFSSKLNLRLMHQDVAFDAMPPFAGLETRVRARSRLSSLLLSYQTNWQTRYYVGVTTGLDESDNSILHRSNQTQVFAKVSYAFSR
jgi:hypothetical protein